MIERRPTTRNVLGPGVQDHDRPVRRPAHLLPRLLGHADLGSSVINSTKGGKTERIGRLLKMHANKREEIKEVNAGDIAAAVGLKSTTTGDTLCDEKKPIILEKMIFPEPVISLAIEPKTKADQEKLGQGMAKLMAEDPTFRVATDEQTGQVVIAGMGELHLEIIVDRPSASSASRRASASRRSPTRKRSRGGRRPRTFIRQTGGRGQFGDCWIRLFRSRPAPGYEFENDIGAARFRRNTSSRSIRASRKRSRAASSPATRSTMSASSSTTVRSTMSTRRKWRSRSPARWFQDAAKKAGRC